MRATSPQQIRRGRTQIPLSSSSESCKPKRIRNQPHSKMLKKTQAKSLRTKEKQRAPQRRSRNCPTTATPTRLKKVYSLNTKIRTSKKKKPILSQIHNPSRWRRRPAHKQISPLKPSPAMTNSFQPVTGRTQKHTSHVRIKLRREGLGAVKRQKPERGILHFPRLKLSLSCNPRARRLVSISASPSTASKKQLLPSPAKSRRNQRQIENKRHKKK